MAKGQEILVRTWGKTCPIVDTKRFSPKIQEAKDSSILAEIYLI